MTAPPPRGPRIVLYGHDTVGLGHLRRNLTIAHRLARDLPEAHFLTLTGSNQAHAFPLPPRMDFVKIPSAAKNRDGVYEARALDLPLDELRDMRSRLIAEALRSYRPDLVLVDHAPAGMDGELMGPLEELRAVRPRAALVLGLRDVIDEPGRIRRRWKREGLIEWIERIYDRVLIYGPPGVGPSPEAYGFSRRLLGRVRFTNYVVRLGDEMSRAEARRRLGVGAEPLILLTVGGGDDGEPMLQAFLDAHERDPALPAQLLILTGPLMNGDLAASLRARARGRPGVTVIDFDPDLPALLAAADVVVSMAGYNTMSEILRSGVPAVVVPRVHPRLEQWMRASALQALGLCRVVPPAEATGERLRAEVEAALAKGLRSAPLPFGMDGVRCVSQELRALIEDRLDSLRPVTVA